MAVAERANRADGLGDAGPRRFAKLATSARNLTISIASILGFPRSQNDNRPSHREPGPAAELDCLRSVLAPSLLAAAEQRSDEIGVGADQVLIQWGVIGEEEYLRALASHIGLIVETFSGVTRSNCPLPDASLCFAARHSLLPLWDKGKPVFVYTPTGYCARRISRLIAQQPWLASRIRLTSSARLRQFLEHHSDGALARLAADGLAARFPALSAAPARAPPSRVTMFVRYLRRLTVPLALLTLAPLTVIDVFSVILAIWFLLFTSLRLAGCFSPPKRQPRPPRLHDSQLPVYTVGRSTLPRGIFGRVADEIHQ